MRLFVVDASALVELLLRTPVGRNFEPELADPEVDLHIPALCDVEVVSALRRLLVAGIIDEARAGLALTDLVALPLTRHGHQGLLPRMLRLRHNFSAYDAAYVTLAERLGAGLVTGDGRLATAAGTATSLSVLGPQPSNPP
jgi:predicted nucleic acid-binding protein